MGNYLIAKTKTSVETCITKDDLGGKGYGLVVMSDAGINVPPFAVIPTQFCRNYMADPEGVMEEVKKDILPNIITFLIEKFGYMPLVSVRSGAKFSMPGMMDTILNVGLTDGNLEWWSDKLNAKCVADSKERLEKMYASVVGTKLPLLSNAQLEGAIEAVFKSWMNDRAKIYRQLNKIPDDLGTAVVIQAMVFGNLNDNSCTGVLFSRSPSTGEDKIVGEFLPNAQGEDVVAGTRTPLSITDLPNFSERISDELIETVSKLEAMNKDMQDIEFTVQDGTLYILQTRNAKRTAQAAVRVAVDLVKDGVIDAKEALTRVTKEQFLLATKPVIPDSYKKKNPAHGLGIPASNGCVSGVAVFSNESAVNCKGPCILVSKETTPDDIAGMNASVGILTSTGGFTSHAAVVARGMEKVCVVGCMGLLEADSKWFLGTLSDNHVIIQGTKLTIDGSTGEIWVGVDVPIEGGANTGYAKKFQSLLESVYPQYYRVCVNAEEMEGAKKVMLSTCLMDRPRSKTIIVSMLTAALNASKGKELVVDLRNFTSMVRESDFALEYMFGAVSSNALIIDEKIKVLGAYANSCKTAEKIWVLPNDLSDAQTKKLSEFGYKVAPIHFPAMSTLQMVQEFLP